MTHRLFFFFLRFLSIICLFLIAYVFCKMNFTLLVYKLNLNLALHLMYIYHSCIFPREKKTFPPKGNLYSMCVVCYYSLMHFG